jgi:hypothetical protein
MALDAPNFNMLAPLATTETELVSGIPDAENEIYNAGTTYATGDLVWYAGKVFRSKVDSNIGNTPVEGVNWSDLGEVDEGAVEYDAGTTYSFDAYAVYQGQLWKSAVAGESGNTPSATSVKWVRQGATNRFKAFDKFLQDEASLPGGIPCVLEFSSRVTCIAILRASGFSVNITITDDTAGEVYNEDFSLLDVSAVTNWYEYFYYQPVQNDTVLAENLPPYTGAEISITFSGDVTSVGQILAGAPKRLGAVKVGTSAGIESYSLKERDDFNRSLVVARPYSDTVSFDLAIDTQQVGYVKRQLALRDALETLFFMNEGGPYGAVAYGFFRDFDILHSTLVIADCVLEIEGLG